MIKVAIMKHGFIWTSSTGATLGPSKVVYEQRISLKERPEDCAYGNPQRRISEVMSDHSLSS